MDRFLNEEDTVMLRQSRHELLRALVDEIPAQVAENDDGRHAGSFSPVLGVHW
jgi:hypothetical protein